LSLITLLLIASCQPPQYADIVFRGGAVVTMDDERSHAQAAAVYDGKIIFVGSNQNADPLIGIDTKIIELKGKMLMPSFHDGQSISKSDRRPVK
jgi:predicted amidohydrolase YtcJ